MAAKPVAIMPPAESEYDVTDDLDASGVLSEDKKSPAADNDNKTGRLWGSIITGAAIGLLVGGGVGLLFAPKRGTDLRSDLGVAVEDLKDKAEQVLDDLQDSTADLMARSKTALEQTRENLVRSVEVGREAYVQKKSELNAQLEPMPTDTAPAG